MTIRDAIGALPPDAIAQVVRAYEDAESGGPDEGHRERAAQAFREALVAVLPQEAGAPQRPEDMSLEELRAEVASWSPESVKQFGEWLLPRVRAACTHSHGYNAAGLCFDCLAKIAPSISEYGASRAPSEAAPRPTRDEVKAALTFAAPDYLKVEDLRKMLDAVGAVRGWRE